MNGGTAMFRYAFAALAAGVLISASLIPDDAFARRGGGAGVRGGGFHGGGVHRGGAMHAGFHGGTRVAGRPHPSHPIAGRPGRPGYPIAGRPGRPIAGYPEGYYPRSGYGAAAVGAAAAGAAYYGSYGYYKRTSGRLGFDACVILPRRRPATAGR